MIDVVRLWETLAQSAKTGTSGYQTESEFNRDLESSETSLLTLLAPVYSKDFQVQEMLSPFVKTVPVSQIKPADYFRIVSVELNGQPSFPINPNQASLYKTSPVRKPTASNGLSYYYFEDDQIKFIQLGGSPSGNMTYISYPKAGSIVLQNVSDDDTDYVTPTKGQDLEWPESAFNLILYMMMQRLGLSMKENILIELSNLGIQMEASKL